MYYLGLDKILSGDTGHLPSVCHHPGFDIKDCHKSKNIWRETIKLNYKNRHSLIYEILLTRNFLILHPKDDYYLPLFEK